MPGGVVHELLLSKVLDLVRRGHVRHLLDVLRAGQTEQKGKPLGDGTGAGRKSAGHMRLAAARRRSAAQARRTTPCTHLSRRVVDLLVVDQDGSEARALLHVLKEAASGVGKAERAVRRWPRPESVRVRLRDVLLDDLGADLLLRREVHKYCLCNGGHGGGGEKREAARLPPQPGAEGRALRQSVPSLVAFFAKKCSSSLGMDGRTDRRRRHREPTARRATQEGGKSCAADGAQATYSDLSPCSRWNVSKSILTSSGLTR